KGHFNNTSLDGLNVVGVFHTPGHMFTGPKWKVALYLDERAGKEQADALGAIFSGQAGGFFGAISGLIGEVAGVRAVPIRFDIDGKKRSLNIPSTVDISIEAMESAVEPGKETVLTNAPMTVTPGFPAVVSKSTRNSYSDHGMK